MIGMEVRVWDLHSQGQLQNFVGSDTTWNPNQGQLQNFVMVLSILGKTSVVSFSYLSSVSHFQTFEFYIDQFSVYLFT